MSGAKLQKAIFLDRDGVINKLLTNHPDRDDPSNYVIRWDQFEFIPEAIEGLKLLADTDYKVFIVSNQSGIGRGYAVEKDIQLIFDEMCKIIKEECSVKDLHYFYCEHTPDIGCCCRKPQPGMIYYLACMYDIDLSRSWMIGDSLTDIAAAYNAGVGNKIGIGDNLDDFRGGAEFLVNVLKPDLLEVVHYIGMIDNFYATAKT